MAQKEVSTYGKRILIKAYYDDGHSYSCVSVVFFHYALSSTLLLSLLFTVIAFIGDVFIMPRISHLLAIGTDFILAFFGLALLSWFVYPVATVPWLPAFLAALIIMVAEIFFFTVTYLNR